MKSSPRIVVFVLGAVLSASYAAAQTPSSVAVQRDVEYGRVGSRSLRLDIAEPVTKPTGAMPVVCFIHGGGWSAGNKESAVPLLVPLAEQGYFCVSVGYRLTGEAVWPAQIHDCKAAIRFLRANAKKYHIDPDRIGVWGASAGGHLVAMLGTSGGVRELEGAGGNADQSARVTCVLNWFGPTDLVAAWKDPNVPDNVKALLTTLLGRPAAENLDALAAASPVKYVSADDAPTLTMHGTKDPLVPLAQAQILHDALKKAGVDSTLVIVEGAGHGFGGPAVDARVRAFFEKHLRGKDVKVSAEPIRAK
jgi:acetyl esterase/lipase